ncbi:hypothetical protein JSO62_02535 [Riemerella anatipestifer]|uniref:hypothetical protein n=1 Tax=Riemerella anatipestifer TaxID=34085 RepID=UPI0030C3BD3F
MNIFIKIIFILSSVTIYSQKIGIVSNVNPTMGYVFLKGAFKVVPVYQENLHFNILNFLEEYLKKENYSYEFSDSFDFSKLEDLNLKYINKKEIKYINEYCEKYGYDKILILRKNTNNTNYHGGYMYGINDLNSNFGIAALSSSKKRAFLFTNFLFYTFHKGDNDFKNIFGYVFTNHKFEESIYDENMKLVNQSTILYFLSEYKNIITNDFDKFLK